MKKILFLLALSALGAQASSLTFANSPVGPQVVSSSSVLIGNGMLVRIGTFTIEGDTSSFVEFGTSVTASVGPGTSRVTGAAVNNGGETDDAQFNAKNVYLWIYNSATRSDTADQGIFRATAGTPAWVFPTDGGALDTVTLSVLQVNSAFVIPGFTEASVIAAGGQGNPSTTNAVFKLGAAVPEPSSLMFGLLSMGLLARRKR